MNLVILKGRLTRDVDVRTSNDGNPIVRFSIAVDRSYKNAEGRYDADFINCVAFKSTADFVSKYFNKGKMILITGRIQTGSYTNRDGQKVYTTDVVCDKAEFCESKNSGEANNTPASAPAPQVDKDGFMNIPDGIPEELPFN